MSSVEIQNPPLEVRGVLVGQPDGSFRNALGIKHEASLKTSEQIRIETFVPEVKRLFDGAH